MIQDLQSSKEWVVIPKSEHQIEIHFVFICQIGTQEMWQYNETLWRVQAARKAYKILSRYRNKIESARLDRQNMILKLLIKKSFFGIL